MRTLAVILLTLIAQALYAEGPLYVVNGTVCPNIDHIPQEDIESLEVLAADEETIAEWGIEASEGVILLTLRYDTPARFESDGCDNFTHYLATHVRWDNNMPAERASLRIQVDEEGRASIAEVLHTTSRRFLNRIRRAIDEAPLWSPATRNGTTIPTQHLVNLQLPEGKSLPVEHAVIIR